MKPAVKALPVSYSNPVPQAPPKPRTHLSPSTELPKVGFWTATLIVVANMIGSGVFGTTGELAEKIPSAFAILACWAVGGAMALCGALAYGELAARLPRSGGEYHFLTQIYGRGLGFVSGFVSVVVGFAAPIALNALFFGEYFKQVVAGAPPMATAAVLVVVLTLIHALKIHYGAGVQNVFTLLKVGLIVMFIIAGIVFVPEKARLPVSLAPRPSDWSLILSPAFAVALVSVYYGYLGWNASVYMTGEIRNPTRTVPLSLVVGTTFVAALYMLLNYVFVTTTPLEAMSGKVEVGALSAAAIFGETGGKIVSLFIGLALVSSAGAMVMLGPRIAESMGKDHAFFRFLARRKGNGGPWTALLFQMVVALIMVFTESPLIILVYMGFTLSLFSLLSVIGVFILRMRDGKSPAGETFRYRTWGYPLTPALFVALCVWMIANTILNNPTAALSGLATLMLGAGIYLVTAKQ
ncbi:MAG: amino acid permease [Bacteroidia bacterium]|nr:amino acid permease [Bacteroidia bacterium]MDW8333232.1 amino acid permease [Bacteroidia bacterium]